MPSQRRSLTFRSLIYSIIASLFLWFSPERIEKPRNKSKQFERNIPKKIYNELAFINYRNLYKLNEKRWIIYVDFENKIPDSVTIKTLLKISNFGIIKSDSYSNAKILSFFKPENITNLFICDKGVVIRSDGSIIKLDFSQPCCLFQTIEIFLFGYWLKLIKFLEKMVHENKCDMYIFLGEMFLEILGKNSS